MIRVAIYALIGTDGLTIDGEICELRAAVERNGWCVTKIFIDQDSRCADGAATCTTVGRMLECDGGRDFDLIAAWSADRLGRSLRQFVAFLTGLQENGIDLYLHQQRIDTTTPDGRALFGLLDIFAAFEQAPDQACVPTRLHPAHDRGHRFRRASVNGPKIVHIENYLKA